MQKKREEAWVCALNSEEFKIKLSFIVVGNTLE